MSQDFVYAYTQNARTRSQRAQESEESYDSPADVLMGQHEPATMMTGEYEVWEPWLPKVGDRVQVRLRGECPHTLDLKWGHTGCHMPCANGATGVVGGIGQRSDATRGHRYTVYFNEPVRCHNDHPDLRHNCYAMEGHYAAIELEPLIVP